MLALLVMVCYAVSDYELQFMERFSATLDMVVGLPSYSRAMDLVASGDTDEAFDTIGQAALENTDTEVGLGYVNALHQLVSMAGTTEEARREYVRVAGEIAPFLHGEARYGLLLNQAVHQRHSGDADLATATLEGMAAEISDPANEWYCLARYQQAQVAIGQGDWSGATRYLEELRRLGHHYPESLQEKTEFQLLNAYGVLQKWEAARELGESLRSRIKDPDHLMSVLYHLAEAYSVLGLHREASDAYSELERLLAQHPPERPELGYLATGVRIKAKSARARAEAMEAGRVSAEGSGGTAAAVSAEALPAPASPFPVPASASVAPLPPAEMMKLFQEDTGPVPFRVRLLSVLPFTGGVFLLGALAGGGAVFLFTRRRRSAG